MARPVVVIRQPNRTPIHLAIDGPIDLGRECDGLLLADGQVSRRHLQLDMVDGEVVATDQGSTNGTTIDGHSIDGPTVLTAGAKLLLGGTTIELDGVTSEGGGTPTTAVGGATPEPPPRPQTGIDIVSEAVVQAVGDNAVDVGAIRNDEGTVTIVFSDIEASTERNVALGDAVWFEVLGKHNAVVEYHVNRHGGTIIKNQGDGFMLSFPSARRALQCMIAVQGELAKNAESDGERAVRIRVGMHTGEVLRDDDGDMFGQHVVVAARVANLAEGGEILVSALVREIVASRGDVVFGDAREVDLKGIGGQTVYPVDWSRQLLD